MILTLTELDAKLKEEGWRFGGLREIEAGTPGSILVPDGRTIAVDDFGDHQDWATFTLAVQGNASRTDLPPTGQDALPVPDGYQKSLFLAGAAGLVRLAACGLVARIDVLGLTGKDVISSTDTVLTRGESSVAAPFLTLKLDPSGTLWMVWSGLKPFKGILSITTIY